MQAEAAEADQAERLPTHAEASEALECRHFYLLEYETEDSLGMLRHLTKNEVIHRRKFLPRLLIIYRSMMHKAHQVGSRTSQS